MKEHMVKNSNGSIISSKGGMGLLSTTSVSVRVEWVLV